MARYGVYENPLNGYREKVKEGFNWLVLLFGPLWFFFNGMVGSGLGWLLVALLAGSFTFGFGGIVVWIIAGARAGSAMGSRYLRQGWKPVGYEQDGEFRPL